MSSFSLALKLLAGATIAGSILSIPFFASKATTEVNKDEVSSSKQGETVAKGSETGTSSPSGSSVTKTEENDGWGSKWPWF